MRFFLLFLIPTFLCEFELPLTPKSQVCVSAVLGAVTIGDLISCADVLLYGSGFHATNHRDLLKCQNLHKMYTLGAINTLIAYRLYCNYDYDSVKDNLIRQLISEIRIREKMRTCRNETIRSGSGLNYMSWHKCNVTSAELHSFSEAMFYEPEITDETN